MNGRTLRACVGIVGVLAVVAGCAAPVIVPRCSEADLASGTSHFYVVNLLSIAVPAGDVEPFTSVGFNVDGDAVAACNSHIVGVSAEFAGQAPDFGSGIDNALGGDLSNLIGDGIQSSVDDASTLLVVEVRSVDDFTDDSCVGVSFYRAKLPVGAAPRVGVDGHLASGQMFNISETTFVDGSARIVAGRLQAGPGNFPLTMVLLDADLALLLRGAQLRFNISETAISDGVLGGYLITGEVSAAFLAIPAFATFPDIVRDTFTGLADIDGNDSPTSCEAGSIAFMLDGVSALRGIDLGP